MMDPDYMPLIHRDSQNIAAVLLSDGWHPVEEGDSAHFLFHGWANIDDEDRTPIETGLAIEFQSDRLGDTIIVPIAHVLAYRLDNRMRIREVDERYS